MGGDWRGDLGGALGEDSNGGLARHLSGHFDGGLSEVLVGNLSGELNGNFVQVERRFGRIFWMRFGMRCEW